MAKYRGNNVLTGTWAEIWLNGERMFECYKIEAKVIINREDVQIGLDIDSKVTSMKGEGTLGIKRVYSAFVDNFEEIKKGIDNRFQIITKLADPDAVGGQIERYSIDNSWLNELPLVNYENGALIEQEISFGFTPSDMINLDKIA